MKRLTIAIALLAGLAAAPAAALAMEPYLPKSEKSFRKLDADANGSVTAAEIAPRAAKRFLRLDADGDGAVTAAEIDATLTRALERRRDRIMAYLDQDKDGRVTRAELDGFVEQLVSRADSDRNGGVSLDEAINYRVAKLKKPATGE